MAGPPLLADPVSHILALLSSSPSSPRITVALAGVPGSGKSTLAAEIAADLNRITPNIAAVLSHDGFHLSRARLSEGIGEHPPAVCFARRGAPFTFDGAGLASRLSRVLYADADEVVPWPSFDHAEKDPREGPEDVVRPEARVLILEGIYTLSGTGTFEDADWRGLPPLITLRLFLDTSRDIADARLAARHVAAWGITIEEAKSRIAENDGPNGDLVVLTRASAHFVVHSRSRSCHGTL